MDDDGLDGSGSPDGPEGFDGGVDPERLGDAPPRPRSSGSVAMGRAMMALGDIIEGKPPRDEIEHVLVVDDDGEPVDPRDLVIEL
jgi:hypothetical protein